MFHENPSQRSPVDVGNTSYGVILVRPPFNCWHARVRSPGPVTVLGNEGRRARTRKNCLCGSQDSHSAALQDKSLSGLLQRSFPTTTGQTGATSPGRLFTQKRISFALRPVRSSPGDHFRNTTGDGVLASGAIKKKRLSRHPRDPVVAQGRATVVHAFFLSFHVCRGRSLPRLFTHGSARIAVSSLPEPQVEA